MMRHLINQPRTSANEDVHHQQQQEPRTQRSYESLDGLDVVADAVAAASPSANNDTIELTAAANNNNNNNNNTPTENEKEEAETANLIYSLIDRDTEEIRSVCVGEEVSAPVRQIAQACHTVITGHDCASPEDLHKTTTTTNKKGDLVFITVADKENADRLFRLEQENCCNSTCIASALRASLTIATVLLLMACTAYLFAAFINTISQRPVAGIFLVVGYFFCHIGTYYLEGGQCARFMAKGNPPSMYRNHPHARRFVDLDENDPDFIARYMSVRQFLTLGTTTLAGGIILNSFEQYDWMKSADNSSGGLLLACHLFFTTTLFQVLPQIRAERTSMFIDRAGCLFTYYLAEFMSKVVDPGAVAEIINDFFTWTESKTLLTCCGHHDDDADDTNKNTTQQIVNEPTSSSAMTTTAQIVSGDPSLQPQRKNITKFPGGYNRQTGSPLLKWPSPERVAQNVGEAEMCESKTFCPPNDPLHISPHVVIGMLKLMARKNNNNNNNNNGDGGVRADDADDDAEVDMSNMSTFERSVRLLLQNV